MASCDSNAEQHNRKRVSVTKGNSEASRKPVYRRRRISQVRHGLKIPEVYNNELGYTNANYSDREHSVAPLKGKGKRHERERSKRLSNETNVEKQIFNEGDMDSDFMSTRMREKHFLKDTSRVANDYHKLSKRYRGIQEQYQKLASLMETREAEYHEVCSRYEAVVEMLREMEEAQVNLVRHSHKLEADKAQSDEDITLLKSIVYRLNAELERYQDKLGNQKLGSSSTDFVGTNGKEKKVNQRAWAGVNFHAMGPLLNAYEECLSEKQELVNMYEREMTDFGSRCKEILTENELMHKEVEELRSECNRYGKEVTSIIENTALLKKQNDLLQKESVNLKREANEIRMSYESKIEVVLKHNDALKREQHVTVSELNNLKGKYEVLSKEYEKARIKEEQAMPTSVHTTAIGECKTLLDELKHRYETEKRNLCNKIKHMEENQPENERQLVMITADRNHLKELVQTLEKNFKREQRKVEHAQTILHSTRISRDSLKEQLSKATAYCEDLFSEYERIVAEREKLMTLLRETEKENASIDRLGKTITSRVDSLKSQLDNVRRGAKQQVETVEKRIKVQELKVRRMKREYHRKILYLRDAIKQKEETIDKLQKEKQTGRSKSTRHCPSADDEKPKTVLPEEKIRDL